MSLSRPLRSSLQRLHYPLRFAELKRLLKNQQLTPATLQQQQQRDLTTLIQYAVSHSPYYGNRFSNLEWDHQLNRLPILQKQDLITQRDQLLDHTADPATIKEGHTGGSTGTPLTYYYDQHKLELMRAGQYRSFMQCGWKPGESVLQFWGATQDLSPKQTLSAQWQRLISAEQTLAAFEFNEARLQQWCREIQRLRPVVIRGYPSILAELARYILEQQIPLPHTIRGCFCTAEVLYPWQRKKIEAAFQCKLYNQYGSREVPNISCECSHGNQHVFTDLVALESIEVDREHQLLVTSLTNRLMPFIRYQIGDHGQLLDEPCSCGPPFPLMEMEVCRSNDLLQSPNGQRIYPAWFIHLLDGVEGVEQYQFLQPQLEQITLTIVAQQPLPEGLQHQIEQQLRQKMGKSMRFTIKQVAAIPRGASGKHRFVRCDIN